MPDLKRDVAARRPAAPRAAPSAAAPRAGLPPAVLRAALLAIALPMAAAAPAQDAPAEPGADLDRLFEDLAQPGADQARIADRISALWSRSGSASADLLLRRGREALEDGDYEAAIEHLTALTDHAPDFAEGWSARATAYYAAGRVGESLSDLGRALELEPRHFGALAGLGFVMEDLGFERDALSAYRASAALNPGIEMVNDAIERLERALEGEAL